jgi:hypothetical protein
MECRRHARKVVKVAGAVAAFAVTFELCARVDDFVRFGAPPLGAYSAEALRATRDGVPCNVPMARYDKWQNNSLGFRGPELPVKRQPGKSRVVCLGASESYGMYETPGREWPSQLQGLLGASSYEVVNASVVGLDLKKYVRYFDDHVAHLKPDLVVLVINPLFYVSSLERRDKGAAHAPRPARASAADEKAATLRSVAKLKQAVKQGVATSFPSILKRYQVWATEKQVKEIEAQRLKGAKSKGKVPDEYLERFHDDLTATVTALRNGGAEVVLTTYPSLMSRNNIGAYREIFLDNRRFCIELSLQGMLDAFERFNTVIASVATEQKTMLVDAERLIPRDTENFADNVHYKDSGARHFAEGVARCINHSTMDRSTASASRHPSGSTMVN